VVHLASLFSLLLGPGHGEPAAPGEALNLPLPDRVASTNLKVASLSVQGVRDASRAAQRLRGDGHNEILQIVVFSCSSAPPRRLGDKAKAMINWIEELCTSSSRSPAT